MIATLLCIIVPLLPSCSAYVQYAPPIDAIVADKTAYDRKTVLVTGSVRGLDRWKSRRGPYRYVRFDLCESACVRIFMEGDSIIHDGERVTVRGPYYRNYTTSDSAYPNEIEATEIIPRE